MKPEDILIITACILWVCVFIPGIVYLICATKEDKKKDKD